MKSNNDSVKNPLVGTRRIAMPVLAGMLIGGVIGTVAGLLFAPHSGKLTRAEIRYKALELHDQSAEAVKKAQLQAKSKANELKENIEDKAVEIKQQR